MTIQAASVSKESDTTYDMDSSQTVTHISLCAGYGGIDLGLKRAVRDLRTVAFSEIEGFACANLVAKMEAGQLDAAPIWSDLKTFPWSEFRDRVDILSGGYPCQPFSAAGKRRGKDDPRHLWPWIADGIRIMRPRVCFFENVEGHISLGLREVVEELAGIGYTTTWGIFSASEVGAPHQRKRVFILAYRNDCGRWKDWMPAKLRSEVPFKSSGDCWFTDETSIGEIKSERILADADCFGNSGSRNELGEPSEGRQGGTNIKTHCVTSLWPSRPRQPQHGWEPPRVVANATSKRCDREFNESGKYVGERDEAGHIASASQNASSCGGDESVVNTESKRSAALRTEHEGLGWELCAASASGQGVVGNTADTRLSQRRLGTVHESRAIQELERSDFGQTQLAVGRNIDGSSGGLDYAELCVTCDNRTDELRLLGNGVVPATAELAFKTLMAQLDAADS